MSDTAIERRQGDALSQIVGTGDTRAALATLEQNVRDIIDVCRERGFVTHYTNFNKKTGEVRESDFYGLPAWQLLGMTYGVTSIVTDLQGIDGGYKAYAVARTRDGVDVGGDFGLCHRKEGGKEYKSEHDLAAMASARAKRNALRAAFGAALVLAGFDFPDPDAPATTDQVGVLHILEREIGWDHDQGHVEAGDVASYRDLTREAASELIERWTALRDKSDAVSHFPTSDAGEKGTSPVQGTPSGADAEVLGEGAEGDSSGGVPTQACLHPEWEPVKGRDNLLRCTTCGVGKKNVKTVRGNRSPSAR